MRLQTFCAGAAWLICILRLNPARKGHGKYVHRHTDFDVTSEDTNAEIQDKLKKKRDYDRQMMAKQFEKHGKKGVKKVSNNRKSRRGGNDIDDLLNDDIGSNRRKKRG